jgi:hypothetical protein
MPATTGCEHSDEAIQTDGKPNSGWRLSDGNRVEGVDILFPPNVQGSRASAHRGPARRPPSTGRCAGDQGAAVHANGRAYGKRA